MNDKMLDIDLKYTQQIRLNRIIDPLGLRILKTMEDQFFQGITTQTPRLRYFTLLTWWYKKIEEGELDYKQIFKIEKIFTLIAKNHHLTDKNPPIGIRNSRSAGDFLHKRKSFKINSYKKFGVPGRNSLGYGDYYYRNPLRVLGILKETSEGEVFVSKAGKKIADIFENLGKKHPFEITEASTRVLSRLRRYCLCRKEILESEQKLWRYIFFGHVRIPKHEGVDFDEKSFNTFYKCGMIDSKQFQNWNKIGGNFDSFEDFFENPNIIQDQRAIKRGYSLLLAMMVINKAQPKYSVLNQTFRDVIYFKQVFSKKDGVQDVNFEKLEYLRSLWEVYVHNLYYISTMEGIFFIFLKFLETKPFGTTISEAVTDVNEKKIRNTLHKLGFPTDWERIEDLITYIKNKISSKSNLRYNLNERTVFLDGKDTNTKEEHLAYLIVLLLLLKHRYDSFNDQQKGMLDIIERDLGELSPSSIYRETLSGEFPSVYNKILMILKNRHRLVSVKKYIDGTKSWLLTEDRNSIFHYGKHYYWKPYREAKWTNVVELLYDLGLIDKKGEILKTSRLGITWLKKIM